MEDGAVEDGVHDGLDLGEDVFGLFEVDFDGGWVVETVMER